MVKYKLIYFNLKARAEVIRYIFAHSGVEYEDVRYDFYDQTAWMKDKQSQSANCLFNKYWM